MSNECVSVCVCVCVCVCMNVLAYKMNTEYHTSHVSTPHFSHPHHILHAPSTLPYPASSSLAHLITSSSCHNVPHASPNTLST